MYLLDTNVVSEVRRGSPQAIRWLRSVDPLLVYLSVVTLGEIARGIAMKQAKDEATAAHLSVWLQSLRRDYRDRTLAITDDIAIEWGRVSAKRTRGAADALISATAIVHSMAIVTRNVADFRDLPIAVVDPWAEARA